MYTAKKHHKVKIGVSVHSVRYQLANKVSSARQQGKLCRQSRYGLQENIVSSAGKQHKLCEAYLSSCCVHAVYIETGGCGSDQLSPCSGL